MPQVSVSRYCAGCMTKTPSQGKCANPSCRWNEAGEVEAQEHLPRHYILRGRYYMGRVLGQGGFGVTYIARDLTLDRAVAIKEFLPSDQCSRSVDRATVRSYSGEKAEQFRYGLERFLSEAQNVASLGGHPNIVQITDHLEANGTAYMVMEFIEGITLKQYLASQGGRIPPEIAQNILLHAMSGLKRAHEHNLLHRDVSPDNIMISRDGPVKLIDFGAARLLLGEASQNLSIILKHGYAPEEQYRSRGNQGPWTDVYATAATLYRCVTGVVPPASLDRQSGDVVMDAPSKYCPQIPFQMESAIMKGLSIKAAHRYQSIAEMQNAMLEKGKPDPPNPQPPQPGPVVPPKPPKLVIPTPLVPTQPQPPHPVLPPPILLPPSLHWLGLLAIGWVTGGLFLMVWPFVQANWIRKIDPSSQARKFFALYTGATVLALCILIGGIGTAASQTGSNSDTTAGAALAFFALVSLFGTLFFFLGAFNMRRSLLDYYNRVEPIGLRLSGGMTFFFTILYIQYHLSRIAMYKRTGFLPS